MAALSLGWRGPTPLSVGWRVPNNNFVFAPPSAPPPTIALVVGPKGDDGAGLGFRRYTDSAVTEASPLTLQAGVPAQIQIDGLGGDPASFYTGAYQGLNALVADRFRSQAIGETFILRLTLQGKSSVIGNRLRVSMDIGGAIGVIDDAETAFPYSAGEAGILNFKLNGYALDTFLANGARFLATASQDAEIWGAQLLHIPLSVPS